MGPYHYKEYMKVMKEINCLVSCSFLEYLEHVEFAEQWSWIVEGYHVTQPDTATSPPRTGRTGFFLRARGRGAPSAVD